MNETHSHDTATPALSVESEHVLLPREPSDRMTAIGQKHRYDSAWSIGAIYRAMIAAAPAPNPSPAAKGGEAEAAEEAAKLVYDAMVWAHGQQPGIPVPKWIDGGNSDAQYEARRVVRKIAELAPNPSPAAKGGEALARELFVAHSMATNNERGSDRIIHWCEADARSQYDDYCASSFSGTSFQRIWEAVARAALARLSEALAEAEKKGAEVRELPWERRAFGGLWTAKTSLGSYFVDANEEPCEWAFGRQDYRAAGSLEEAKAAAQADYEARVRACFAPPRDLSQGGQHG